MRRTRRLLVAVALVTATVGAWWSGEVPCRVIVTQPACQLAVTGGPVIEATRMVMLRPAGGAGRELSVREPAGRLLVTTIEVSEPGDVASWWAALRDPEVDLVARARLVPPGGDLDDVAEAGRARMVESRRTAVALALDALGLIAGPEVPEWAWPVGVSAEDDEVGGPSAGLMLALGVIARLAPEDPTARPEGAASGRAPLVVAGTGALDEEGRVLGVGGIEHKLRSVVDGGASGPRPDAFLLPLEDLPLARRVVLDHEVLLVPVVDLAGAIDALGRLARGDIPVGAVRAPAADGTAR